MDHDDTVVVEEIRVQCNNENFEIAAQLWSKKTEEKSSKTKNRFLCLHGFLDNCRSYHFLAPFLVSKLEDAQVVALDLPGHGLSTHKSLDHPPMMIINDYCYYVAEFVQKLNWGDGFILIGHSLGAAISVIYAATCSQQVTKLVLLDGYGPDSYELYESPKLYTSDKTKSQCSDLIRRHVNRRYNGNNKLKGKPSKRIYQNMEAAVQTRIQAAQNSPGNQWISYQAAFEMVKRAVVIHDNGTVQFLHDSRQHWPPLMLHSVDQIEQYWNEIACRIFLLRPKYGWPYPKKLLKRADEHMEGLGYVHIQTFSGSHYFHADPETAVDVAQAVLKWINS